MIPVLFESTATAWTTNGLGRLADAISCTVEEERNGVYELTMRYPMTGAHYSQIDIGSLIVCRHCDQTDLQPFRVYKISRPLDGVVTIHARHISYDLAGIVVKPFTAASITELFRVLPSNAIGSCPFSFWTDKTVLNEYEVAVPSSIRSLLGGSEGSILDVYGTGEYEWDGYTVKFHLHRGQNNGVTIRYAKNLTALNQDYSGEGIFNGVAPYYADEATTVTLTEGAVTLSGVTNPVIVPLDMSGDFESAPTEAELRTAATTWLNENAVTAPKNSLKVSFVQLWQTNEYKDYAPLQRVSLCDTVNIEYPQLGVSATAEVVRVVYNVLLERYDSMEIGDPRTTLSSTLAATEKAVDSVVNDIDTVVETMMGAAIQAATDLLAGGLGGHVVINRNADGQPNEILIMDTDSVSTAQNVIRLNMAGIGFSTSGYNGPFTTAWTIDGTFYANWITAGILSAILIQGPTSDTFWDLATGIFQNYGQSTVTAQVETADGTYTPTTYTLSHKVRIAAGILSLLATHSGSTELQYLALGLAAQGMDYEFYEGIAGSGESTSYPYAGLDLSGDTVTGMSGYDVEYDGRTATYRPAAHYTPDYWEIGGAENLSTGANQYPDRNQLRAQAGWGNYENAIVFTEHYKWEETPSGIRRQFHASILRRPAWEYAVDDQIFYDDTDNARMICSGYLTDARTSLRFFVPLSRPFHPDVQVVEIGGEMKVRRNGDYLLGSGSSTVDISDYTQTCKITAGGLSVLLKRANNATFSNSYNNNLMMVDIYGFTIYCYAN